MKAAHIHIVLTVSVVLIAVGDLVHSASIVGDKLVRYDGYKVYSLTPRSLAQVEILQKFHHNGLDFWHGPSGLGIKSDVMVSPGGQQRFISEVTAAGIEVKEFVPDVQRLIENETLTLADTKLAAGDMDLRRYNRWDVIYNFLDQQAKNHPDTVKIVEYGQSGEGRPLKVISISKSGETKPAIFIEAGIHSREWIAPAVALFMIDAVLNGDDEKVQAWLDDFDLYVSVLVNVDGYAYTHSNDRMWRKTRSKSSKGNCRGADPNRNWPYKWMVAGTSRDACSEIYGGPKSYSENESKLLAKFVDSISSRLVFYFALHSYGNFFLIPYAYSKDHFPFYDEHLEVANRAVEALAQRYSTKFKAGTLQETIQYLASGGSIDTIMYKYNTKLVLGAELRGGRQNGFILPASEIEPSSLELMDAFQVFVDYLRSSS